MEARQIGILLAQAEVQRRLGNHRGATDLAQRALSITPDHAVAHATLAAILLDARRLPGAGIEIRIALGLDGNDPFIHRVAAAVLAGERKLDDAWAHCLIAIQAPSPEPEAFVLAARVCSLRGDRAHARELLHEALAIEAAHTGALTQLARLELAGGDPGEAARVIQRALERDPADRTAHVVAGFIDLARGEVASAEHHARFVLQQNAVDPDGHELWAAVQARKSRLLGAWWRWNAWISLGDDRRRLALSMAGFVLAQVAVIATDELGWPNVSRALQLAWLGFCACTWFAPALLRRMVSRALATVRLDPEF